MPIVTDFETYTEYECPKCNVYDDDPIMEFSNTTIVVVCQNCGSRDTITKCDNCALSGTPPCKDTDNPDFELWGYYCDSNV